MGAAMVARLPKGGSIAEIWRGRRGNAMNCLNVCGDMSLFYLPTDERLMGLNQSFKESIMRSLRIYPGFHRIYLLLALHWRWHALFFNILKGVLKRHPDMETLREFG